MIFIKKIFTNCMEISYKCRHKNVGWGGFQTRFLLFKHYFDEISVFNQWYYKISLKQPFSHFDCILYPLFRENTKKLEEAQIREKKN